MVKDEPHRRESDPLSALRSAIVAVLGVRRAAIWFGPTVGLALGEGRLRLTLPNQFHLEYVRRTLRGELTQACQQVLGQVPTFEWVVAEAADGAPLAAEPANPSSVSPSGSAASHETLVGTGATLFEAVAARPGRRAARSASAPPHQAPAAVAISDGAASPPAASPREPLDLASFVPGTVNQLAWSIAQTVAHQPGTYQPVLFHGPTGVGKSHLLEGICTEYRRRHPRGRALVLTAEQYTTSFLAALRGSGLPSFRHKMRGVELLAIDDVQFFFGKRATLEEVLHTVKALIHGRRQVVLAADRPLEQLGELGPELVDRLRGGMVCGLAVPDEGARVELLRQRACRLGLELSDDLARRLAAACGAHVRQLQGTLHRLHALSRAHARPVTAELMSQALDGMAPAGPGPVGLREVERAVQQTLGLGEGQLRSAGGSRRLTQVRILAMYLARKHTPAALAEIGSYFGVKSHSSVISAERKVRGWLRESSRLPLDERPERVDELIRRVEARLSVG